MNSLDNPPPERLVSLDTYRGAIMLLMASSGLGVPQVARNFPASPLWKFLGHEFDHALLSMAAHGRVYPRKHQDAPRPAHLRGPGHDLRAVLERAAVLLGFWLVLLWMYRRRIFLRI